MQRRHHQVGSINQRLIKLKLGQKTAFPFPLMVSPCLAKGKQSYLPYPLTSTKPAFTAALPFAVWRLDIKYLLFVLLTSAVRSVILSA